MTSQLLHGSRAEVVSELTQPPGIAEANGSILADMTLHRGNPLFPSSRKVPASIRGPSAARYLVKKIRRLADINLKLKIFIDIYRRDTEIKEEQKNRYVTRSKWEYRYFSYHSLYVYQTKTNNCSDIKKLWLLC